MTFSQALDAVKLGSKISRAGWNGKGMHVEIVEVEIVEGDNLDGKDPESNAMLSYLELVYPAGSPAYPTGARVPWLASQTDLLADDWSINL